MRDNKLNIKPITERKTAKELVYHRLKSSILDRVIDHKEIFTETTLAESLQTSRTPIREALADLINEGLVVHVPRTGYKVREVTENEMEQIIFLRKSIELYGVRVLTEKIDQQKLEKLYDILSKQEETIEDSDNIAFIKLDQLFHKEILHLADLHFLSKIFSELYNLVRLMSHEALIKKGRHKDVVHEHLAILEAIASGDPELAAKTMDDHLTITVNIVKDLRKR